MNKSAVGSIQLMVTLFVSGLFIILSQNYYSESSVSLIFTAISAVVGVIFTLLYFVPTIIIIKNTEKDFFAFARAVSSKLFVAVSLFYALYFVYVSGILLKKYADGFNQTLNPDANALVIVFVLLCISVYASNKGISAVTRCGIFIFVFCLISLILIYTGNISNLDFSDTTAFASVGKGRFIKSLSLYMSLGFVAVLFSGVAGRVKSFKVKYAVIVFAIFLLVVLLYIFFVVFALGKYGNQQNNQLFLLSKSAHFDNIGGLDCLFQSAFTFSVFITLSLLLIGLGRLTSKSNSLLIKILFAGIIFAMFVCMEFCSNNCKIMFSIYCFDVVTFIAAVIIPSIYIIAFRRKLNV